LLAVKGLTQPGIVEEIHFELHRGEVLGISGLMGSGRTELVRLLFGLESYARGEIRVRGKPLRPSPRACIHHGMAFLTEDRRREGLLMEASLEDNIALASLSRPQFSWSGVLRLTRLRREAARLTQSLGIACRSVRRQSARTLSGGNQQKVVLAKWLLSEAEIFLLDEPTRGVDVAARYDLYRLIGELVERGAGVLLISSEMEELVGMCDRILVMSQGEIRSVLSKGDFDRDEMLRAALGKERLQ
jgi:ribose transport system ATP-binding protein